MSPEGNNGTSHEKRIPTFNSLGNDINESLLALEAILYDKLGDMAAVQKWMTAPNHSHLDGKSPEVVLNTQPDKVVAAALAQGQFEGY